MKKHSNLQPANLQTCNLQTCKPATYLAFRFFSWCYRHCQLFGLNNFPPHLRQGFFVLDKAIKLKPLTVFCSGLGKVMAAVEALSVPEIAAWVVAFTASAFLVCPAAAGSGWHWFPTCTCETPEVKRQGERVGALGGSSPPPHPPTQGVLGAGDALPNAHTGSPKS